MKRLILYLSFVVACQGSSRKLWIPNLNYDTVENWDKMRLPCPNDRIIIPEPTWTAYFQTNATLKEMILPMNSDIVFGENVQLNFASDPAVDLECAGEDITFIRNDTKKWFNPTNWKDEDLVVNVETELVPCTHDQVAFSPKSVFHAELDQSVSIATMKIGYETYTTSSLSNFLETVAGLSQFQRYNAASIELTQKTECEDITGCVCGNDKTALKQKICNLYTCPNIACQRSLLAKGGCCNMCGAILSMNYDSNKFNMKVFEQDMYDAYSSVEFMGTRDRKKRETDAEVYLYISKVTGNKIQMVLTDNVPGTNNGQAASDKAAEINDALSQNNKYGLLNISLSMTSDGKDYSQQENLGAGAVTGIVIAVLIALVVTIVLSYLFVKTRPFSRSWFQKDDPLDANIEMAPGIAVVDFMRDPGRPTQGFDNPMYDSPTKENFYMDPSRPFPTLSDDTSFSSLSPTEERRQDMLAFSNPLPDDMPDKMMKKTAPAEEDGVKAFTNPLPDDLDDSEPATIDDDGRGFANPLHISDVTFGVDNEADA
ncbi:protein amnionless-like [Antedon mediterranea]|uniref:protein amnionless-like n=1 Tax=Antedon mediterranea TaxID=105859 RepID=UPI003AF9FE4D